MKKISLLLALILCMLIIFSGCSHETENCQDSPDSPIEDYLSEEEAGFLASDEVPVSLTYVFMGIDYREYEVTDTQMINYAKEAIRNIRVHEPADMSATDFDEIFVFNTVDGKKYSFGFNARNLASGDSYYTISNDGALWSIAKEISDTDYLFSVFTDFRDFFSVKFLPGDHFIQMTGKDIFG